GCDTSPTIPGASWCPSPSTSQNDFRSDAFAGEELEQDRVLLTAVDDVSLAGSALQGAERGLDLGQHAAVDHAFLYKALRLLPGQGADEETVEVLRGRGWGSRTPWTSVRWISFSARRAAAMSPATRSALMLYVSPPLPTPTGAMTGTTPLSVRSLMA